ncbi:MAG: hypothetical protein LBQ50_14880 [Planctomycetaceae bacterium]|nr:hypothetical protein [Planctomycetaceae bacterium]
MKNDEVKESDCVRYQNFLLLPEDLERLHEVIRIRKKLDPAMTIPAFPEQNSSHEVLV